MDMGLDHGSIWPKFSPNENYDFMYDEYGVFGRGEMHEDNVVKLK